MFIIRKIRAYTSSVQYLGVKSCNFFQKKDQTGRTDLAKVKLFK
jgi:hypothetical protein